MKILSVLSKMELLLIDMLLSATVKLYTYGLMQKVSLSLTFRLKL